MIGLAIVLGLIIIIYFATTLDVTKADEESQHEDEEDKTIHLTNIPTPEQKATDEKLKEQWLSNFSQLIRESNNNNNDDTD
jgi:hypothetical protein